MNTDKYIKRIGYKGLLKVDLECLKTLHKCHLMSIPFEALDVQFGQQIILTINDIYNKVIIRNRGGYCYELNYLFHLLLMKIGFENHLVSARIFENEIFGPEYDHMAIIVQLNGLWLVDVGYGNLFIEPIQIQPEAIQNDYFKHYKISQLKTNQFILSESLKDKNDFKVKYKFENKPRKVNEFDEQNRWKQSSKESYFVQNRVCTIPTEKGRKTILNNTYKRITSKGVLIEDINTFNELGNILSNEFNIVI